MQTQAWVLLVGASAAVAFTLALSSIAAEPLQGVRPDPSAAEPLRGLRPTDAGRAVQGANAALGVEPPDRQAALGLLRQAISAGDDALAVSEAHFLLGRLEEDAGSYEAALEDDRAAVAAAPDTRWATRASERMDWLRARSEGGFAPLRRLEGVRRDPQRASNPEAVAALAEDAEQFPPGLVRVEARMFVADAYLGRMRRPEDGILELRRVVNDPLAEPLTVRLAERELVDALTAEGHIDEAAAEARAHAAWIDPGFAARIARLSRRRIVRALAYGVLASFAALVLVALARAARRKSLGVAWKALRAFAPLSAAFMAFIAFAGATIASSYERGNGGPFLWLGLVGWPLVMLSRAWSAVGSRKGGLLACRLALSGASVVAAAFAVLDGLTPGYLEGFGL
jgi:hypothetical protein